MMPDGGGDGFQVDPDQLKQMTETLRQLHERTVALIELAADANPDWAVWGLVGAPFAVWYWQYADDLYANMQLMGEALDSNVRALGATAEAYEGADKAMADALARIHRQVETKGRPW